MGRTAQDLYEEARKRLVGETNVTSTSPGAVARTLLQVYSEQLGEFYKYVDTAILNTYISTAKGRFLDLIGSVVGVSRTQSTFANAKVRFLVNTDTDLSFNEILALLNERDSGTRTEIIIPSGTTIRAGDKSFVTVGDATLTQNTTEFEVDAISTLSGRFSNTDQGSIDTIVWPTPVLSILNGLVKVTNDAPVESGRDTQSDDEYRFFIVNQITASAKANETAIRVACLSVPGVSDVIIENYAFGIGTFAVYVTSTSPITTQGTLAAVQQAINFTQSEGAKGKAISPDLIGVQIVISLEFLPTTNTTDKNTITRQTQINAINYINNLKTGEELVLTELSQRVMDTSDKIHDNVIVSMAIGDYNTTTGVIDNADTTIAIANQKSGVREKFVSNKTLLTTCYT